MKEVKALRESNSKLLKKVEGRDSIKFSADKEATILREGVIITQV